MIHSFNGIRPTIGENVFIAPTAVVIGDVTLEDGVSIWYHAVIRGDTESIRIGRDTNIQDHCTVHADPGMPAVIGENVVVGHNAVIHGCTIEDRCLIGIGAIVMNQARICHGSVLASGSVVVEGKRVGPFHLVAGVPAAFKKSLSVDSLEMIDHGVETYRRLADLHRQIRPGGPDGSI